MLFARAKSRPSLSLQSRDRPAAHDPAASYRVGHHASTKDRVEHAHLLDETQDPNPQPEVSTDTIVQ